MTTEHNLGVAERLASAHTELANIHKWVSDFENAPNPDLRIHTLTEVGVLRLCAAHRVLHKLFDTEESPETDLDQAQRFR